MKLDWIKLVNFRQYYGEQRIRFARDKQHNVTVINGINGAGKTSLFMALNWCLYGQGAENVGELISKRSMTEASIGEQVETRVELMFTHEGKRYIAMRAMGAIRESETQWQTDNKSEFMLMRIPADGQAKTIDNPEGAIESILPSKVRTYFFFDGEKIDNFAKPNHENEVESAVRNVLKIEVLERAKRHLSEVARDYRTELKKNTTGELQKLLADEEAKQKERDELQTRLAEQREEQKAAKRQMEEIDKRLAEIQDAREMVEKRRSVTDELVCH